MLAAVKPRNMSACELRAKLIAVAMSPMAVMAPSFRIHHAASDKTVKPIRSHKIGKPVSRKTMGEKIELRTPQRAAPTAIAATSWLLR